MSSDPRPDFATVYSRVADVQGWMSHGQAAVLYEAAVGCPADGMIVEIGSFQGRSTIVLASAAPPSASVIAIDPHAGNDRGPQEYDGFETAATHDHTAFVANLEGAGVADRVRHLRMVSDGALGQVEGEIDVLYIDGAHRYGPARSDIRNWGARIQDGGTMLIHDSFSSIGVTCAIARELFVGARFRYVGRSRSMAVYRADLDSGLGARARNAGHQLAQLPWFLKNLAVKVALTLGLGKILGRFGRAAPDWPY